MSFTTRPVNVSYLVIGLVFLGIAGSWALREIGLVETGDIPWLLPLVLVVAGGTGLVAFAARSLGHADAGPDPHGDAAAVGEDHEIR